MKEFREKNAAMFDSKTMVKERAKAWQQCKNADKPTPFQTSLKKSGTKIGWYNYDKMIPEQIVGIPEILITKKERDYADTEGFKRFTQLFSKK